MKKIYTIFVLPRSIVLISAPAHRPSKEETVYNNKIDVNTSRPPETPSKPRCAACAHIGPVKKADLVLIKCVYPKNLPHATLSPSQRRSSAHWLVRRFYFRGELLSMRQGTDYLVEMSQLAWLSYF
jgi:hypothetical protein